MTSAAVYAISALGYVGAFLGYGLNVALDREWLRRAATVVASLAFMAQTLGLALRWYEAGLHEVAAREAAEGVSLQGLGYFVTVTSHPPWSNLYEIMVFMSWGIVIFFLISEVKWRLRVAGVLALGVALLAFGIASLTLDARVTPLVPALRSYWLHFHVFSASVGYAAGLSGAIASMLYLARSKTHPHKIAFGAQAVIAVLVTLVGRGSSLFASGAYRAKIMAAGSDGALVAAGQFNARGDFEPHYAVVPGAGLLMLLIFAAALAAMILHRQAWRSEAGSWARVARIVSGVSIGALTLTIALLLYHDLVGAAPALDPEMARTLRPAPPYRFALNSNQWDLALFMLAWLGGTYALVVLFAGDALRTRLPSAATLDRLAYRSVMLCFTFVSILIVTGAIWAHYAWGRYWGWDPKETGSLVIWFVYAGYLHTRITHGLSGRPSAVIAILGFFVVLAGFLGVNLGWFSSGLHSYGGG